MKKGMKIGIIVVGVVIVLLGVMMFTMGRQMKKNLDAQVNAEINMEQVADGTYKGSSDSGLVKVEVEVEVKEHEIVNINLLKHQCGTGKPAEVIIDDMVKKNTDDVDSVSGATASSKTIRNAVNKALQCGLEK